MHLRSFPIAAVAAAAILPATAHAETLADADIVVIAPLPGRPVIAPGAADWCGARAKSNVARDKHDADSVSRLLKTGDIGYRRLVTVAELACENSDADTPGWRKQIASWRQAWVNLVQLTDKEDRAMLAIRYDEKRVDAMLEEACKALPAVDAETPPEQKNIVAIHKQVIGCGAGEATAYNFSNVKSGDYNNGLWWIDRRPEVESELLRAYYVTRMMMARSSGILPDPKDPETVAGYVAAAPDGRALDRKKLEAELTKLGWNEYARLRALELHGMARTVHEHLTTAYQKLADADPDVKKVVLDEPTKAYDNWVKVYAANKATFEAVWAFEQKLYSPNKRAVAGCAPELYKLLKDYLAAVKNLTGQMINTYGVNDSVMHIVIASLVDCHQREGRVEYARIWQRLLRFKKQNLRGGRVLAYSALVWHATAVRKDREAFFINPDKLEEPFDLGRGHAGENPNTYEGEGEVAAVKKQGDDYLVTFSTVVTEEDKTKCRDTSKIYRIWPDGRIEYEQDCVVTGTQKIKTTPRPLIVPAEFGADLKKGQYLFSRGEDAAQLEEGVASRGIPVEVYTDKTLKKQVSYFGIPIVGAK
jgi:hypothetical protein